MAVTLTYLITNIIRTYAAYLFIKNFLKHSRVSGTVTAAAYGLYYIADAVTYLKMFNLTLNVIVTLSMGFLMGFLYNASYYSRLLASVFLYILALVSEDCTAVIIALLSRTSYYEAISETRLTVIGITVSVLLLFLIVRLVIPLFHHETNELPVLYWSAVFLIPSGCIFIIHNLVKQLLSEGSRSILFVLTVIIILFSINILVFFLYNNLMIEESTRHENVLLHSQLSDYKHQAALIQEFQQNLHDQKHSMTNHFLAIQAYAEQQKTDDILSYINRLIGDMKEITTSVHTGNLTIDSMINSKLYLAKLQSTSLIPEINLCQPLVMNNVDLTLILGNLLDNALEACSRIPAEKRKIHFYLSCRHNTLTLKTLNACDPSQIDMRKGKAYTTKTDKSMHEIGLKQIQKSTEKYDGIFEYGISKIEDLDVFKAEVLLYLDSSKQTGN